MTEPPGTVEICESFKAIGIDISEHELRTFERALYERGLNIAARRTHPVDISPDGTAPVSGTATQSGGDGTVSAAHESARSAQSLKK